MTKSKKITILVIAVIVLAMAGAGTAALTKKDNKGTNSAASTQSNSQASLDTSMQSMSDGLKGKTGDEYDKAFINLMSEHHAGAIAMAQLVDTEAKHPELRTLAGQIIAAQTKEIDQMKSWASAWGYEYQEPKQSGINAMTAGLKGKTGDELDHQFIKDMISHHMGAIDMANLSSQNAKHDEIKKLSDDIFDAQTLEIGNMQDWAKMWGYDIGSSGPSMPGHQMPM